MNNAIKSMNTKSNVSSHMMYAVLIAVALVVGSWNNTALAKSYRNVDCSCDPATSNRTMGRGEKTYRVCSCTDSYEFKAMATKEFRFRCKHRRANSYERGEVPGKGKKTSCTDPVSIPGMNYKSRSCTNWRTNKHRVKLEAICFNKDAESED